MSNTAEQTTDPGQGADELVQRPPLIVYRGDLDRLRSWGIAHHYGDTAVTLRSLLDTVAENEVALRFYADLRNHRGVGTSSVYNDRGDRARAAVGKCEPCGGRGYVKTGHKIMDQDGPYEETATCRDCHGAGCPGARF